MQQYPMAIWNQIAQQPEIKHETFKTMFLMSEAAIEALQDEQGKRLEARGIATRVILAYQMGNTTPTGVGKTIDDAKYVF